MIDKRTAFQEETGGSITPRSALYQKLSLPKGGTVNWKLWGISLAVPCAAWCLDGRE